MHFLVHPLDPFHRCREKSGSFQGVLFARIPFLINHLVKCSGEKGVFFKTSPLFLATQKFTFLLPKLPFLPTSFYINLSFSELQQVFESQKLPENSLTTP
jgi:hypothetical protein